MLIKGDTMKTHATRLMLVLVGLIGGLGCAEGTYEELDGGAMEGGRYQHRRGSTRYADAVKRLRTVHSAARPGNQSLHQPQGQALSSRPNRWGVPRRTGVCDPCRMWSGNLCALPCRPGESFMDGMVVMSACQT